jgi:phosphatidate cytidylyltransferase
MNNIFYLIIFLFFLIGGIGIYIAGRKQNLPERKKNRIKFITYFLIVNTLLGLIFFADRIFFVACMLIVIAGMIELIRLQRKIKPLKNSFFYPVFGTYLVLATLFCFFSYFPQPVLLFTLFTVCTFDAFCQITGQLFGKRKICPKISPNKTLEGLIGGVSISIGTFCLLAYLLEMDLLYAITLGLIICLAAFGGDLLASWIKRKYDVKDFSPALPGHGGFLDRFDSLIVVGAFVFLFTIMDWQFLYCCLFCAGYLLLLAFCELLHKKGLDAEYTRKLAHTVSTLSCLLFPVLFSSPWYVFILMSIAFCILFFGYHAKKFVSINAVNRETYGSFLLPVSIGITYYLSLFFRNQLLFTLPILILAISDSLACVCGKIFKSKNLRPHKTVIGTSVFFLSTFVISNCLLYSQSLELKNAWIALGISVVTSAVELISSKGSDNLTIPLSAFFCYFILLFQDRILTLYDV